MFKLGYIRNNKYLKIAYSDPEVFFEKRYNCSAIFCGSEG